MTIVSATIDGSSPAVPRYAALVAVTNASTFTLATSAAIATNGGPVVGIALDGANPGGQIGMLVDGIAPGAMAKGSPGAVTADANGILIRSATWTSSCFGTVDATGAVTFLHNAGSGGSGGGSISAQKVNNVISFGAKADGVTDDTPAIQAAIDASGPGNTSTGFAGIPVYIPKGTYRCASTIVVRRECHIFGDGGIFESGATQLVFDSGVQGIFIQSSTAGLTGGSGQGSVVSDLVLKAAAKSGTVHGLLAEDRVRVENVTVNGFPGDGMRFDSGVGGPPRAPDLSLVLYCRSINNTGNGFICQGGDGNVVRFVACDAQTNGGVGIYDNSFLGSVMLGCHASTNAGGNYANGNNGLCYSTFIGCYSEGDSGFTVYSPGIVLGGDPGTGMAAGNGGLCLTPNFGGGLLLTDSSAVAQLKMSVMPLDGKNLLQFTEGPSVNVANLIPSRYLTGWYRGWYCLTTASDPTSVMMAIPSPLAVQPRPDGGGTGKPNSGPWFPSGFQMNGYQATEPASFTMAGSAPTTGLWYLGSRIWNSVPVAGGTEGWVCISNPAGGFGGTWTAAHTYYVNDLVIPTTPNGKVYQAVAYAPDWAPNHTYATNDIVSPLNLLRTNVYIQQVPPAFQTNTTYHGGNIVRSIADNGVNFEVQPVGSGVSGGVEPTWDTTIGNTTISGGCTFIARTRGKSGPTEPVWAASGLTYNVGAVWAILNPQGVSGNVEPNWASIPAYGNEIQDGAVRWRTVGVSPPVFKTFGSIAP